MYITASLVQVCIYIYYLVAQVIPQEAPLLVSFKNINFLHEIPASNILQPS